MKKASMFRLKHKNVAIIVAIFFSAALVQGSNGDGTKDDNTQVAQSDILCRVPILSYSGILVGGAVALVVLIVVPVSIIHCKRVENRKKKTIEQLRCQRQERMTELEVVKNVLSSLEEVKQYVKRHELNMTPQLEDVKKKSTEIKEKLDSVENLIESEKVEEYEKNEHLKEKQNLLDVQKKLEGERRKFDEELNHTWKIWYKIEEMTTEMTERKAKVTELSNQVAASLRLKNPGGAALRQPNASSSLLPR